MVDLFSLAAIGAAFCVPGILLSFAFFAGEKFSRFEKLFIGVILGLTIPPFLGVLEFSFFGMQYTSAIIIVNMLIVLAAAIVLLAKNKMLLPAPAAAAEVAKDWVKVRKNPAGKALFVVLIALMAFGFWLRFQSSWTPEFFEFDPYYYDSLTQYLVKGGSIPEFTDTSYYPNQKILREFPFASYMTGGWYMLYKDFMVKPFVQNDLILTIQLYPPLVGALLAFLVFLYLKEEYDQYVGLIGAALAALMPQLITKFAAGVSELAPMGIFASVMALAFYGIAVKRGSLRAGAVAAFGLAIVITSSSHFIWPFLVLAGFIALHSIMEFISGRQEGKAALLPIIAGAGAIVGNVTRSSFKNIPIGSDMLTNTSTLLLLLSVVFSALLFAAQAYKLPSRLKTSNAKFAGGFVFFALAIAMLSPIGSTIIGYVNGTISLASGSNALYKTVQEGAATNPGYFPSAFGPINPNFVLLLATTLAIISAFVAVWRKKSQVYALAFGAAAAAVVFFNQYVDVVLKAIMDSTAASSPQFSALLGFVITSDVFIYLVVSMVSALISLHYCDDKDPLALLTILMVFPVAYAGLARVKYLLYVGLALAFALPFILGEFARVCRTLNSMFKAASEKTISTVTIAIILLVGAWSASAIYPMAAASSDGLRYSRITADWQESFSWMRTNLGAQDRIIAWWDYGHWIVFFGNSKAVIDPGNVYPELDQKVAHAFVNGNTTELISTMTEHGATYVLFDSELFQKWGALNYLSGTYNGTNNNFKPEIDWTAGPGQSDYEIEHSFEQIFSAYKQDSAGQTTRATCPGLVPRTMLYSSFGAIYCADNSGGFTILLRDSEKPLLNPSLVRMGDDSRINLAPLGTGGGIFYNTNPIFLNVNPDLDTLSNGKLKSKLASAAFVQLYFFEKLDGFEMAYKSPNQQVKIFKLIAGNANAMQSSPAPTPAPAASPTPVPSAPQATPTPIPFETQPADSTASPAPTATETPTPSPTPAPSAATSTATATPTPANPSSTPTPTPT